MNAILTKDQVNHFLTARKKAANLTATGVLLCILSAAPLLALISFARLGSSTPSVDTMTALGVIILLIIVATGIAFFIASNRYIKSYEKLEYENCSLDEETIKQVEAEKEQYASTYTAMTITATVLCIISAIPIICSAFFTQRLSGNQVDSLMTGLVAITLILIATGVFFFVKSNTIEDGYDILFQVKDYSPKKQNGPQKNAQVRHHLLANCYCTLPRLQLHHRKLGTQLDRLADLRNCLRNYLKIIQSKKQ